jgi:hypothetical protein
MVSCYLESVQWILTLLLVFWLHRVDDQLETSKELELQITGAEKLSLWQLLGIQFILLPYTLGKVCSLWLTCSTFTYWQLVKVANQYVTYSVYHANWFLLNSFAELLINDAACNLAKLVDLAVLDKSDFIYLGGCCIHYRQLYQDPEQKSWSWWVYLSE